MFQLPRQVKDMLNNGNRICMDHSGNSNYQYFNIQTSDNKIKIIRGDKSNYSPPGISSIQWIVE
ncbi:hypothetical protein GMMP15_1380005 [Candidatus Magnetomoraceae bacterium gMMP-15]